MRLLNRERYLQSAVMICIANIKDVDYILFEKRNPNIRQGGEISFPGGRKDKNDKDFMFTAIRETSEELGIEKNKMQNISYFGTLVSATGVIIETFMCKLDIKDFDEINYSKDEVEKIIFVPIKFFIENEAVEEKITVHNIPENDLTKYKFPKKYYDNWRLPDRTIKIFMLEDEVLWGMTSEILIDFIKDLKNNKQVGFYNLKIGELENDKKIIFR